MVKSSHPLAFSIIIVYYRHCRQLFDDENILTLINLYVFQCLFCVKKNLNVYNFKSETHCYPTRHNYFIQKPKVTLTKSSRWFDNLAVDMFNKLPTIAENLI